MEPDELKTILRDLGVSQVKFGEMLGHNGRSGQRWCAENVPGCVETIARLLSQRPELLEVVKEIAEKRDAAERKAAKRGK